MINTLDFDEGSSAGRGGKIAARSSPKTGVEKVMKPGGIVCLRRGAVASRAAGIGVAFAPVAQRLVHRHVAGRHRSHLDQEQVKTGGRDRGIGRDGAEIESHQPPAQKVACFVSSPREEKNALAVAERAGRTLIKSVVLGCWEGNRVGQGNAAQAREKQKDGKCFRDGSDRMMHGKKFAQFVPSSARG